MHTIGPDTTADLFFQINWNSPAVRHADACAGLRVNFWRDIIPRPIFENLQGKSTGDMIQLEMTSDHLLNADDRQDLRTINRNQFDANRIRRPAIEPASGRFYPKGVLKDLPAVFASNVTPFRCVKLRDDGLLDIDLGHALWSKKITVSVTVGTVRPKTQERGGDQRSWGEIIARGVGMQARWQDRPTHFFNGTPCKRQDESADSLFYAKPRLVQHIDDTAMDIIRQIHSRFIQKQTVVLDLMSSWQTHLAPKTRFRKLIGLGLNEVELQKNNLLSGYLVHDLNAEHLLPFDSHTFDVVLNSLSVEYLTHPRKVFAEIARVLKPGGVLVVSFSNRWFEPKTIRLWTQLYEFERMGLVLEYFRTDSLFENLNTYSVRGLVRPPNDKYAGQLAYCDPVYAVWARRTK